MVNWKLPESKERLLAAVVASMLPNKVDYKEVAKFFGQGATYSAVENQFRTIRKLADKLVEEEHSGGTTQDSENVPLKARKRTADGKKKETGQSVISGRVSKSKSKSITPKATRKLQRLGDVKSEGVDSGYDTTHMDGFSTNGEDEMQMPFNDNASFAWDTGDAFAVTGFPMAQEAYTFPNDAFSNL